MTDIPSDDRQPLLAMPLLKDMKFDHEAVIRRLQEHWAVTVHREDITDTSSSDQHSPCAFNVGDHLIAMHLMPGPLPADELDSLFPVSPFWENSKEETASHRSHIIVFMSSNAGTAVERYTLFTKVIESILVETDSLGLYQGNQSLLISRENYIEIADCLQAGNLPVQLWLFIGMGKSRNGTSLYTYGLSGFGKREMEIVESKKNIDDLYDFLANICHYVISNDVVFKNGETLGYTQEVAARISISKGVLLEGDTIKLEL